MSSLVEKLTGQKFVTESGSTHDRAMFGSGRDMSKALETAALRPAHRVGLWPIVSNTDPEVAMGIGAVLSILLERYQSVRVYRLFVRLDGEASADYQWSVQSSQFEVDDWSLEGLDENAGLWGRLEVANGRWVLTLELENDLSQSEDVETFSREAASLSELVGLLPELVNDLAESFDVDNINSLEAVYSIEHWPESALRNLLQTFFSWEVALLLELWGIPFREEQVNTLHGALLELVNKTNADLFAWVAAYATARALSPLHETASAILLPEVEAIAEELRVQPSAGIILSAAMMRLRYPFRAYDILEDSISAHEDHANSYLALGELYRAGNDLVGMIDAFQRAIERDVDTSSLDMRYADLLLFMDASNVQMNKGALRETASGREYVEGFILIDIDESLSQTGHDADGNSYLVLEAVEAMRAALERDPENVDALGQLTLHQIDLDDPGLWESFANLVQKDTRGELTRMVVEAFYNLPDFEAGIEILEQATEAQPNRADLLVNLAVALLQIEDSDGAHNALDAAVLLVDDDIIFADIERLRLAADEPDFEAHFGEITDLINAGADLSSSDVDFLEDILDRAPLLGEVYTYLATAYLRWEEGEDALNVLLDGQKRIPHNPEITMLLAKILWDADENALAFDYLNKGLLHNPQHVGLLATTGRYLFEDGQDAVAKKFLLHAEAINPRHPALVEARELIARSQNK